jgi:hypothetical protein
MNNPLLTPTEWCKHSGVEIIDRDGWTSDEDWKTVISFDTFFSKVCNSTTSHFTPFRDVLKAETMKNYIASLPKLPAPVCPYCRETMREEAFKGYYDSFHHWACACNTLPNAEKNKTHGQYA